MITAKFQMEGSPLTVTSADVFTGAHTFQQAYGYAVQAVWTGAAITGTIKLQATIDGTNWSDIAGTSNAVSGPGSFLWNVNGAFYDQYRVYFVYTSGSGTITVLSETKGP